MKIIIAGSGKVGEVLCKDLATEGNDITLIEKDMKILERVLGLCDIKGLEGNGADPKILEDAGVKDTDIFMGVTHSDEVNLISCVIAKKMGAKLAIARVRNPEYASRMDFISSALEIDIMINPEREAAAFMMKNLDFPNALAVETFSDNKVNLVKLLVPEETYLDGLKLSDFKANYFSDILVCIVERGESVYVPTGNFILKANDKIYVTGTKHNLYEFYRSVGQKIEKIKSVFITGGGRIAYYLIGLLIEKKLEIKVIEPDFAIARKLSEAYGESVEVIYGNASDKEFLDEERISKYDSCISLSDVDNENMVISMYANKLGIKKIMTRIDDTGLLSILGLVGLQTIITPKQLIADKIIKIARSKIDSRSGNIETLYRLSENRVEAIEFKINEKSKILNTPLKDLHLKKDILILYLIRNKQVIFPNGSTELKSNDSVIVITTQKFLDEIDQISANK
jgi:trk system potassium uptake protein TrkA